MLVGKQMTNVRRKKMRARNFLDSFYASSLELCEVQLQVPREVATKASSVPSDFV